MKTVMILCGGYGLKLPTGSGVRTKLILRGQIVELEDAEAEKLIRANMAAEAVATSAAGDALLSPGGDTPPEETAPAGAENPLPEPEPEDEDENEDIDDGEAPPDLEAEAPVV